MIATMEHMSVLDMTDDLIEMLKHSEVYINYQDQKNKLSQDKQAQQLISHFLKVRDKYDEVQRFGKYHPDYKKVIQEMMDVKRDVDMNDRIVAYKHAEQQLESILNEVGLEIAQAVSASIKVPTGDPFFDRGCSGGCGSGGSCGCH